MSARAALGLWLASAALDFIAARLLDRLGLIEGLLAPSGAELWLLLPLALTFYVVRLFARFVAPGLLLGALFVSFRPSGRERV